MSPREELAEVLYVAFNRWRYTQDNTVGPKWFALHGEIKKTFRETADGLLTLDLAPRVPPEDP